MSMTYNIRQARQVTIIDLGGQISVEQPTAERASGSGLHELVRDLVKSGHKEILINLRDVSRVDSSGIGELFACFTTISNQGGTLKLTQPVERVENVLRLTKLDTVVDVIRDESAAVQLFATGDQGRVSAA